MNVRGNQYSKGHINLGSGANNRKYWSFGIDEPARYGHRLKKINDYVKIFEFFLFSDMIILLLLTTF